MELGLIGLGRMGGNMAQRLLRAGHRIVAQDISADAVHAAAGLGMEPAFSIPELVRKLTPPRAVWCMVPAGGPTEQTITAVAEEMQPGDTIIDGGNSYYRDSMRRALLLQEKQISFLDAGTSGGIWGLAEGHSLMVGGDEAAFRRLEPIFQALAPSATEGYGYVGPAGAGHFVKMVHNGIEYGMMQAFAEGFELLQAKQEFNLDLTQVAEIWRHGSVIRSWLLDLAAHALEEDPALQHLKAYVEDSGEGRWTVQEAVDLAVPLPVITLALQARFSSRQENPFAGRLLAALRNQFGGHAIKRAD